MEAVMVIHIKRKLVPINKDDLGFKNSSDYLQGQFEKLKTTKYGFSIKIFDGEGNSTNQMELTPNRTDEIKEILKKHIQV
jgi:hypothetical protein